jgi:hypothetical protein
MQSVRKMEKKPKKGNGSAQTRSVKINLPILINKVWRWVIVRPKPPQVLTLFILALLCCILVGVIGLADFPIYFFTDEAAQTILAQDFLRDHFKNYAGEFFPTYFDNGGKYNLGLSVYVQIIPLILFGRSVFVTRLVTVFFSVLAAIAIGFTLKILFKIRHWWVGMMILVVTPAWFLHSRTAFETGLAVSLYAIFIFFYLMYRFHDRKHLFIALVSGALAFYSYSSMQVVILATGCLLLILDGPYHIKGRWITLAGVGELILLGLPYVRFVFNHPAENYHQLEMLGSYWVSSLSVTEKIQHFLSEYMRGLNPLFWYGDNRYELIRHVMLGYGHLPRFLLPFLVIGLIHGLLKLKEPLFRVLLATMLAAPVGAAVVQLGITRILVLVIPATIYTAIGLSICMGWISRIRITSRAVPIVVFLSLTFASVLMLVDSLRNGPLWFHDYSLDGMQYGARQIFPAAMQYLEENPQKKIILSPSWANGTDVVARFMLADPIPIELGSIDGFFNEYRQITPDTTFIMIPDEYRRVLTSDKFTHIRLIKILNYPDGNPGFYFIELEYVPDIQQRFSAEKEARRALVVDHIYINGIQTEVRYSMLDMGEIRSAFDGDNASVIRTLEANPFVIELGFQESRLISRISLRIGGTTTASKIIIKTMDGDQVTMEDFASETSHPRDVVFTITDPVITYFIRIEIKSVYDPEPAHVHLWEISIK